jgi:alpha-N-acetylglucosamine transferase
MATLYSESDLKDIKMFCKNEDITYPDPDIMVDKNGKALYAYATLVMLGDKYISAAIVLAYSIRKLGSKADLVVLVTNDVSQEGKEILAIFFDHIIEIDYVDIPNWRTKIQKHRRYLELVFTKFHIFNLTQYKKILLIDADAIVLRYPDHLFNLNAPAGCLLKDKEYIITYDDNGNYILPEDKEFKWYKKMCECCEHGKLIPKELTDNVIYERTDAGIGGGIMLLEPKKGEFESILEDISKNQKTKNLVEKSFVWPEQQYLTMRYSGKWHSMNPVFFGLQGYPHWKVLFGMQYGGDKPFIRSSKFDISIRLQYPDYILWHKYFYDILEEHQEFYDMKPLEEAIEMNKLFYQNVNKLNKIINMSEKQADKYIRERSFMKPINLLNKKEKIDFVRDRMYQFNVNIMQKNNNIKNKKQIIGKLLNIKPDELDKTIHDNQLIYYSTNLYISYRPFNLQPMWEDIGNFDYMEPIKRLADYFGKTSYYAKLLDLYYDMATETITEDLNTYDRIDPLDRDFIISNYIKSKKSTYIITFWPVVQAHTEFSELIEIIKEYGLIYYTKTITLNKNGLFNLMYWLYDEFTANERLNFITEKIYD